MGYNNEKKDFRDRININVDSDVQYWSEKLGVSEPKLREAVKAVGPMVAKVRRQLHK